MQNSGTLISSAIRPNDSLDQIASAFANEIKGGSHGYETYIDMYNIIVARREWGMLVNVYNDPDPVLNGTYQLKYGNTGDNVFDISDNSNWVKINLGESTSTEWIDSVISILSVEPTLEPFPGHRYLLGTTPGLQPQGINWGNYSEGTIIVEYSNIGTWKITFPTNGMTVRVDNDDNSIYKYEGIYPTGIWKKEKITQVFYIEPTSVGGLTYSVSTDPIFNSYSSDLIFLTKFNTPNNGTASLNINGLGFKDIKVVTKSGVRDLIITDIMTDGFYSLTYNGTYFQMTKPFTSDAYNIKYRIRAGEVITVEEFEQYWVYGDLTIDEGGVIENYGKVIIANGLLYNDGEMNLNGVGELISVDLTNTITYNPTDTIQLSETMTVNGPSVSAIVKNNSLTPSHINSVNIPTAGYLLSNDGESFEWIAPAGITAYTANNGLTESPANNFQLGGTLINNTTIDNDSLYNLSVTGSLSGNSLFKVNNSVITFAEDATTKAITGQAISGIGVFGDSTDNYGVYGSSKNSIGVRGESTNNYSISGTGNHTTAGYFQVNNNTAGVLDVIKIARVSTNGFQGVGFSLETNVGGGTTQVSNRFKSIFTDTNFTTRTSQLQITSLNNAVESTTFTLKGTGQLQLDNYTGTTFDASPTKSLGVDASGNVITFATGGGSASELFYNSGGLVVSTDSTSAIYRTGSINIGTGTATDGRFVVSSSGGTTSLVVDESGNIYNGDTSYNTKFGYQALLSVTASALNNTAFGYQALYANTGSENVAFGYQSLYYNTTGYYNTGFGNYTLYNNETGIRNTAIGLSSLYNNNTGNDNVAVGDQVLYNNSGSNNTAVGSQAQNLGTQSSNNVSVGHASLFNNLSSGSVGIGSYALRNNIIGLNNTAVGHQSLFNNTTSVSLLSIVDGGSGYTMSSTFSNVQLSYISGSSATTYPIVTIYVGAGGTVSTATLVTNGTGFKDTTTVMGANLGTGVTFSVSVSTLNSGNNNVAVGYNSLFFNTTGDNNTAVGYNSLFFNTTGSSNTTIGYNSLYFNTTGQSNTAVGYNSLYFNTTGSSNTAVGYNSLQVNLTGFNNTAIGYYPLASNTTGYENTALGGYSLLLNTTGHTNTAIGYFSLSENKTGQSNTAVGYQAGYLISGSFSGATQSNNSVFIGYDTRPQLDNQTNQIVIGFGATGNGSNSVTLGNDNITKTYLKGNVQLPTVPTTSAGTYSILTRNNITGEVEKIAPAYKVYTALLTQSGTASPVPTSILENTIGDIVWGYVSAGVYSATLNGAFTLLKTTVQIEQGENGNNYTRGTQNFTVNSFEIRNFIGQNNVLINAFIEIRVYN